MDLTLDTTFLLRATKFAADKHRNQKRKDDVTPYINHPIEVTELLARIGKVTDVEILAAALLHDAIEDTATQPDEIKTAFGERVLSLVMECTDNKQLPKAERKRQQVESAPHKSDGAKQIKLADKISNLRDICHLPPSDWSLERKQAYVHWSLEVFAGLKGVNSDLDRMFEQTIEQSKQKLQIKEHV